MSTTASARPHDDLIDQAVRHVVSTHSRTGARIGWLVMASIFLEAWDLFSISFVLIYIAQVFHPSPLMLGLTAAATQAGGIVGALCGGWLSDRIGRRMVFLGTMVLFVIAGAAQAFAPNMATLALLRLILGVPLGSDIASGYTYIMESMHHGEREVMGNRSQLMFAAGEIAAIAVVILLVLMQTPADLIWRITLGLGAVPPLVILVLRARLPETTIWLIQRGRFREAKQTAQAINGDPLDMLPDQDAVIPGVKLGEVYAHLREDRTRWRATLFGWIACIAQALEFTTFAFYLPVLFFMLGVSGRLGIALVLLCLYCLAAVSGFVGPLIMPRIGQRMLSILGFGIVFVSLLVAAIAIYAGTPAVLPFAAAAMLWGHYWDAENIMTIPSMVAKPAYRGLASGVAFALVKVAAFFGLFLFPVFFAAIGKGNATLFAAIFPLLGLLAATFILPEVYGYKES